MIDNNVVVVYIVMTITLCYCFVQYCCVCNAMIDNGVVVVYIVMTVICVMQWLMMLLLCTVLW
jgi:hypothetical protein